MEAKSPLEKETKQQAMLNKAFEFADLSAYSFKERLIIRFAAFFFYCLIGFLGWTTRFEMRGIEEWEEIERKGRTQIGAYWHDGIILVTYFWRHRKVAIITSQSFDGEYTARFIQKFGIGAVRGSSTRGGTAALVELIRLIKAGCRGAFTIDGPKGPPHVVKEGALLAAKKTGNPLFAFSITPRAFWTINSWDKLKIPRPFTKALVIFSEPIYVSETADDAELAARRDELQAALDRITAEGEAWLAGKS